MRVRGMTMAAVLTDNPECPNLVAFSVYDMKPVHFLSMACTGLKWIEKWQKVFDKSVEQNVSMSFLRTEVTDTYNNGMNDVDVADQLWNTYRIDWWMCKRKWWWAIWMWGVQVLLVNAFILYKTSHLFIWKREKKQVLSQYEFHCQVVLEWLCSSEEKEDSSAGDESNHKQKCNEASTSSSCPSLNQSSASKKKKKGKWCNSWPYQWWPLHLSWQWFPLPNCTRHEEQALLQSLSMGTVRWKQQEWMGKGRLCYFLWQVQCFFVCFLLQAFSYAAWCEKVEVSNCQEQNRKQHWVRWGGAKNGSRIARGVSQGVEIWINTQGWVLWIKQ